ISVDVKIQLVMVVILCALATISLLSAISKGFKIIAEGNMIISYLLVFIIIFIGSTHYILNTFFEGIGDYLQNIVGMSLWSDAQKDSGWQNWWTAYYWPWWMTWAPFVGLFIARISRGRTIREVILGSLAAPTLLTFLWIAAFGGAALKIEKANHQPAAQEVVVTTSHITPPPVAPAHEMTIAEATKKEPARAVFVFFDHLASSHNTKVFLSALLCLLLAIHVITLVNSGTLVLCFLDSNGATNPSVAIRLIWSIIIPLIGGGLLLTGGLSAIQTACVIAGFPISILLGITCISLIKSLREDPLAWVMMPEHVRPDSCKTEQKPVEKPKEKSLKEADNQFVTET
ncbi:BCCT family transporter, partial [Acinetobacter baumannii]|nr:BCCT family transporter [Acinetobacter baumannii]